MVLTSLGSVKRSCISKSCVLAVALTGALSRINHHKYLENPKVQLNSFPPLWGFIKLTLIHFCYGYCHGCNYKHVLLVRIVVHLAAQVLSGSRIIANHLIGLLFVLVKTCNSLLFSDPFLDSQELNLLHERSISSKQYK